MLNLSIFSPSLESGFYAFKTSRSLRKSKASLGGGFICGLRDHEARKLSEAREGGGGGNNVVLLLPRLAEGLGASHSGRLRHVQLPWTGDFGFWHFHSS